MPRLNKSIPSLRKGDLVKFQGCWYEVRRDKEHGARRVHIRGLHGAKIEITVTTSELSQVAVLKYDRLVA